jgi:ribosomal protein S14
VTRAQCNIGVPMTETELRAKVRELMASDVLPEEPAPITRPGPTSTLGTRRSRTLVGGPHQERCTICGEPRPEIQHFYIAGQVVRVHAACDAVWQQERMRSQARTGEPRA